MRQLIKDRYTEECHVVYHEEDDNKERRLSLTPCSESGQELLVPTLSDIIYKNSWQIKKYSKAVLRKEKFDSPTFEYNVNGIYTKWNMSIRYWKGTDGKRVKSPVVLCLNLLNARVTDELQTRIKFQFGVFNAQVMQWELCNVSNVTVNLENTKKMVSVGYRDLSIMDRHLQAPHGNLSIQVKLQISQNEVERNSLSQDMYKLMQDKDSCDMRLICSETGTEFPVHRCIMGSRSPVLSQSIEHSVSNNNHKLQAQLSSEDGKLKPSVEKTINSLVRIKLDVKEEVLKQLVKYIYTDYVDHIENITEDLLEAAHWLKLPGLKSICERNLLEVISPDNVASLLLMADEFQCDLLKKSALAYCELNTTIVNTTCLAWRVMEVANPELFIEAQETGLGSSISSNMDSEDDLDEA
uniref:Speckle-type POZ protein B n=1 Tax=Cacopsylla melanoneura TaxID=428564 RepID=A0A8D8S9K0_9HEMI